jgi:hypothetical protein
MVLARKYPFETFALYTREDVARILAPDYRFQAQVGSWGLHGIVRFGDGPNFALFVTLGQVQGQHHFDEAVYESGVVRWQSQPRQSLDNRVIRELIAHDDSKNDVLLFLRSRSRSAYLYLGTLEYLNHDSEREKPVHFSWQIIDFDLKVAMAVGLPIEPAQESNEGEDEAVKTQRAGLLRLEQRPTALKRGLPLTTHRFQAVRVDYAARDARNRSLGRRGEELVASYERAMLLAAGFSELASKVEIVAETIGDGLGFDVRSFHPDGSEKHIEVKATTGPAGTPFFMTAAERAYVLSHPDGCTIYRIYGYAAKAGETDFFIIHGHELADPQLFEPTQYRVRLP